MFFMKVRKVELKKISLKLKRGLTSDELDCYVMWRLSMKVFRDIYITEGPEQ